MAGLYTRIERSTESKERLPANLIHAAFILRAAGKFNDAQILAGLNAHLASRGGTALSGQELTDLATVAQVMDDRTSATLKLTYAEVLRAALVVVEMDLMNEVNFNATIELTA